MWRRCLTLRHTANAPGAAVTGDPATDVCVPIELDPTTMVRARQRPALRLLLDGLVAPDACRRQIQWRPGLAAGGQPVSVGRQR